MTSPRLFLALLFLAAGLAPAREARLIAPDAVDYVTLLPPPPADSSPAGQADIDTVLNVQADRTPAQVERADRVNSQTAFSFARAALGERLKSKDFPKTKAIIDEITREASITIDAAKRHWNRKRPYERDSRVILTVGQAGNSSYPSGHSACAALWCAVWSAIFPDRAEAFQTQVREVMWGRVMCGIHYPTDTEAGKLLGEALGAAFLKNPASKDVIATMRREVGASRASASAAKSAR